jgi:thiol reductant ABC exporter CydC subunit
MIGRLLRLLWPEWRRLGLGVALSVATLGSGVALLGTSAWLIATAALHPSVGALGVAIAGVRFFGLGRAVARYLERLVSHDATLRVVAGLRTFVMARLEPLVPARLAGERSGDLLARLVSDVGEIENLHLRVLGPSLAALGLVLPVAAALAWRGTAFAMTFLVAVTAGGLVAPGLAGWLSRGPGRQVVRVRGELQARLADGIQGAADLVALGHAEHHLSEVQRLALETEVAEARLARIGALGGALAGLCADLAALGILALAIPAVRSGALPGVQLAVLTLLALAAFEAVAPLGAAYRSWGATREAARRVFELLDAEPAVRDPVSPGAPGPGARLEVRGLRFRYPDGTLALDGIDLTLARGRVVAVVGPSGSGKSTLAQLLLRFHEVPEGSVFLDSADVRGLAADAVRERIALASPREHLFAGSLRENLLLARPEADQAELLRALELAGLLDFVASLPEQLDTWIGEQGVQLSGGERQRLLLARALLKDAPILLLDEPAAHLDAAAAGRVLSAVLASATQRAVLLITHRLVGLEDADEIVVLRRGRVAERGSFAELVRQDGAFARALAAERAGLGTG